MKKLDERQQQLSDRIGYISFLVMFLVCALSILVQLLFFDSSPASVLGETIALLAGGCVFLTGSIKKGIFTTAPKKASLVNNLIGSLLCSGFFSILFGIALNRKLSSPATAAKNTGIFFAGITVVCFLVLTLLNHLSRDQQEREEKKYL